MKSVLKPTLNRDAFKVLLVEDNLAEAELLQELLLEAHRERVSLTHVRSVTEATELFKQQQVDVILLNLLLPDRQELDTLTRIQKYFCQHNKGSCPAIVVIIGDDEEELAVELIRAGAQDCLVKEQVESEYLIRSLRYAIARQDAFTSIAHQQTREDRLTSQQKHTCILPHLTEVSSHTQVEQTEQDSVSDSEAVANSRALAGVLALAHQDFSTQERSSARWETLVSDEQRFFTLSLDLLCMASFDGYFKRLNPAWETTLGYTISELLSRPFLEFVHPEEREATQRQAETLKDCSTPSTKFENRFICKDGSYRWLSWTAVSFCDEGLIYAVARDITERKHSEEALRLSEERFRTLVSNIPGSVYRCKFDADWTMEFLSQEIEQISGYPASDFLGNQKRSFTSLIHPDDVHEVERKVREALADDKPFCLEYRIFHADGSIRWLYEQGRGMFTADGELLCLDGVTLDITERKHSEAALRLSQERLQLALEGSELGLWDWNISTGQTYLDPQWTRRLGYEVDEIEQDSPSWERLLHPEDRPKVMEALKAYLAGHTSIIQVEFRMRSKSGEWQWILGRGKVFEWDEFGKPVRMTGTNKDITERKTLQKELALREARLNAFFTSSPIGLCILDDQLRFVRINEPLAEINGLSIHDHIGKTLPEVLPNTAPLLEPLYQQVMTTGTPIINLEVSGETQTLPGIVRHWMTSYFPIPGEEGQPSGVGAVVVEISAVYDELRLRKQAEEELHRTQRFLNSLLENLPVGVFAKDAQELRFVFWNKTLTELMGYSTDEAIGKNDYDLFSQEHANFSTAQDQEAFSTGRLIDNSAELIPTHRGQRIFHVKKIPIFDEVGRPQYILGIADDITEHQQTIDRLRLLERAIAASSNGIVITDATVPDHPLVYLNVGFERITGYSREEVIGKNCRFLQGTDRNQPALAQLRQALQEDRECRIVLRNYRKDGTLFWNEFSISPVRDATGKLTHYIGVHRDITELKQAQTALEQQVLRERLVGAMRSRIRRTLNLQEVLTTAVEEVRKFLQTDRTVIYRFYPDWTGVIVVESVGEDWTPLFGLDIQDSCFAETYVCQYQQGRIRAINDIHTANLTPCHLALLSQLEIKANLVVPLLQGETLWGLLIAHHCCGSRQWDTFEIECLRQLSVQLAIAIQQSTLFEQAQTEIAERKRVEESLRRSEARERTRAKQLSKALQDLKNAQTQLVQTEKMASLGQLVAGVAHEINNPTSFIYCNVAPALSYTYDLLNLISLYQQHYPTPSAEIENEIEAIDLNFIKEDFPKLLRSMEEGASRIQEIVLSLRNFSRLDEAEQKKVDLHQGIDNTLMILQNRLREQSTRAPIQVIKEFGNLPLMDCYPSELNQVFMNILNNAIDALEGKMKEDSSLTPQIRICTEVVRVSTRSGDGRLTEQSKISERTLSPVSPSPHHPITPSPKSSQSPIPICPFPIPCTEKVIIRIADNGSGIPPNVKPRMFDPFFTTKPVGKGTGLGLSISHAIVVKKHKGELYCHSQHGQGTEFVIELPL